MAYLLLRRLHSFISNAWASNILPTQWKDANIIMIYKKGDRVVCGNSRGISLLSVAGKLLARVMLIHLLTYVVDTVVPESQCGFRRARSTTGMTFLLPSSTLQRLSTPSIVTCCGKSWANLDALHIFLASYENSILI